MVVPSSNSLETKLFKLMADRQKLESQINTYNEILQQNGNIGMSESLVDAEGYPRNDIDVYQVRRARQQILCLKNDYRAVMDTIEQLLHELHANAKQAETSQHLPNTFESMHLNESPSNCTEGVACAMPKPILKVQMVAVGSPAEQAGLRQNDEILEFGSANPDNFVNKLETIFSIVKNMRGRPIAIKVLRNNEILDLILIPQTWSGSGLLGCNVILINK